MNIQDLKELGFETAHNKVVSEREKMKKLHIAYNNFEFITPEHIEKFNERLKQQTQKEDRYRVQYDTLVFIPVKDYTEAPPEEALVKMKVAIEKKCFDNFEIAKIESIKEIKDPILFGCINGCGDKFFIAQWDNDVTLEMIKG